MMFEVLAKDTAQITEWIHANTPHVTWYSTYLDYSHPTTREWEEINLIFIENATEDELILFKLSNSDVLRGSVDTDESSGPEVA